MPSTGLDVDLPAGARRQLHEELLAERLMQGGRARRAIPVRVARGLPLLVGAVLAAATVVTLLLLVSRAEASRNAQVKLAKVQTQVNLLGGIPWALVHAHRPSVAVVTKQLRDTGEEISQSLGTLEAASPLPQLRQASATVRANLAINARLEAMIVGGNLKQTAGLAGTAYTTRNIVLRDLDAASTLYQARAHEAMDAVVVVTSAAILILLLAFAFFYTYSIRGRRRAESLARRLQGLADALRDSEAHLKHAHQLAGIGSWTWSVATERLTASDECAEMHGWIDQVPPQGREALLKVIDHDDRPIVAEAIEAALKGGGPTSVDYHINHPDGQRLIHLEAEVVYDENRRISGLIGICQDITQRFRLAESERANQAKNEFISRMSHELRTPLNAILGFGQLLHMEETDEHKQESLGHVVSAGQHLLDLINEILDLSWIEAGRLHLTLQPVAVATVVQDAIALVKPSADERSIALSTQLEDEQLLARADAQRLKQVLLNLLSNAVKYNEPGGGVLLRASAPARDRVHITVLDDGPGIAPAVIERLFTPFERLGAEQSGVEGTGLGLAVSKRLVEAMGGTINVISDPGNGAAFTVQLDAAEPVPPAASPRRDEPVALGSTPRDLVVLSIEDNRSNRALIEQIFRSRPHVQVVSAPDGASGLELAAERSPDLVLLDLNLPDMPGLAVLTRLKTSRATTDTPVVIVSADATLTQLEQLAAAGAHDYLTKPVDMAALLGVLDEALQEPGAEAA